MIYAIVVVVWFILGLSGFIYWWTAEFDLGIATLLFGCFISFLGPLNFIFGFMIHGDYKSSIVLIHKRS